MAERKTTDDNPAIARRNFLLSAGGAVAAGLTPTAAAEAQQAQTATAGSAAGTNQPCSRVPSSAVSFCVWVQVPPDKVNT